MTEQMLLEFILVIYNEKSYGSRSGSCYNIVAARKSEQNYVVSDL